MIISSSSPPFDEAHRKVAAYLRLCGLTPAVADQTSARLLETQLAKGTEGPGSLTDAVANCLMQIDAWAGRLVPGVDGESLEHRGTRGRARVLGANLPTQWPETFLAPEQPSETKAALAKASLQLTPPFRQTTMTPQPFDLGAVSRMANETWRTYDKWPVLRGLTIWGLFLLLLGAALYLVRF